MAIGWREPATQFTFRLFCKRIRYALEEELEWKWRSKMNGRCVPEEYGLAAN